MTCPTEASPLRCDVRCQPIAAREAPGAARLASRDALTVASGIAAFGLVLGITIVSLDADPGAALLGTVAVYGGSAQLSAVTLLHGGALVAATLTAAVVNLRLLFYSAALSDRFTDQPRMFRWLAPHFIIDQTYLMAASRPELRGRRFRRYWLGTFVLMVWTGSVGAGIAVGPALPSLPHLPLIGAALFLGLLVPCLVSRPATVAAVVGGLVAAVVGQGLPELAVPVGAAVGAAAALLSEGEARHV